MTSYYYILSLFKKDRVKDIWLSCADSDSRKCLSSSNHKLFILIILKSQKKELTVRFRHLNTSPLDIGVFLLVCPIWWYMKVHWAWVLHRMALLCIGGAIGSWWRCVWLSVTDSRSPVTGDYDETGCGSSCDWVFVGYWSGLAVKLKLFFTLHEMFDLSSVTSSCGWFVTVWDSFIPMVINL